MNKPNISDIHNCYGCGVCTKACPVHIIDLHLNKEGFYEPLKKCSSGGVGFEIGKYLLGKGYKVVGVRYNAEKGRAEHFIASSLEELVQTTGSKYIQSYPVDGWKDIDRNGKYLVTGTPCQIDSFRYYMKKMRLPEENFILLDFFCHGVPSMLAWQKYCKDVEKRLGEKIA